MPTTEEAQRGGECCGPGLHMLRGLGIDQLLLCFAGGDVLQWIIQRLWISNLGEALAYAITDCVGY